MGTTGTAVQGGARPSSPRSQPFFWGGGVDFTAPPPPPSLTPELLFVTFPSTANERERSAAKHLQRLPVSAGSWGSALLIKTTSEASDSPPLGENSARSAPASQRASKWLH